jgi:hypothetical protein
LPELLALLVIVIHASLLATVQAQPAGAVTVTLPEPALAEYTTLVGVIEYVQATPAWVTMKFRPAAAIMPVRDKEPAFAATEKLTVPLPEPLLVVVIHESSVLAVHAQPAVAVTPNVPVPPPEANA